MLGETPLPAKTRSVFEYLSQKDRVRLQAFRTTRSADGAAEPPSAPRPPSPGPPPPAPGGVHVPRLHPSVAKAALSGFQPFTADPLKQSRYTAFLTFQADASSDSPDSLGFGPLPGQSTDEFNKELEDYAKSATVFKPLSGAMASRFRSGAVVEMGPKVVEGLHQPTSYVDSGEETQDKDKDGPKEEEDPRVGAVRLGMFGRLTRESVPWQPARLLCKRFGVKEPEVDMTEQAGAASSGFEFATAEAKRDAGPSASASGGRAPAMITAGTEGGSGGDEEQRSTGPRNLANVGLGEDETQGRDILTYERPAMDVFKAIFASDDEDSDDEDEKEGGKEDGPTPPLSLPMAAPDGLAPPPSKPAVDAPAAPPPQPNAPAEKIDLATFKPTFVPRSERTLEKSKESKKKHMDKEKKRAKAALMSFDVEDDGSIPSFGPTPTHKEKKRRNRDWDRDKDKDKNKDGERKKKRRKERQAEDDDDDSMWVEKPAPEVVKGLPVAPVSLEEGEGDAHETGQDAAGPQRGRKRAVDFM